MKIDALLKQGVTDGIYPGAVFLIARADKILFFESAGSANLYTDASMVKETVFDLASLTKPLATALVMMHLLAQDQLSLTTRIVDVLPGFEHTEKRAITIEHLLCHTSGFPDYKPYFKQLNDLPFSDRIDRLKVLLTREPLLSVPGARVCYSDLGFMVLAWVIETICLIPLPAVAKENIYQPLGLNHLFFPDCEPVMPDIKFAATEKCPWRKQTLVGTVHDDNAGSAKGLLGHAGLFGDAQSLYLLLLKLLQTYKGEGTLAGISPGIVRQFLTPCQTEGRVKGFDTPAAVDSASGKFFSKKTIGHLGFTGTSFWMDLERELIFILLTNRVHPSRQNEAIKAFRPKLHNCAMQSLPL